MIKISAVIIAFNEEKKIGRCIESLLPVADEIVVVDSYSSDRTVAICQQLGAKVIQHPFENYIEQKNYALDCISYPWALSLDADEALSDELCHSILQVKKHPQADAYSMNRITSYCGRWIKHCGWYPDRKIRLFKRTEARWGGSQPHETIFVSEISKIQHLTGNLLHYSFDSHEEYLIQQKKFAAMAAAFMHKQGKTISLPVIYIKSGFKFFRDYILKTGFLEGRAGLKICLVSAAAVFKKYRLLHELNRKK